jgi:hypothetical protein
MLNYINGIGWTTEWLMLVIKCHYGLENFNR